MQKGVYGVFKLLNISYKYYMDIKDNIKKCNINFEEKKLKYLTYLIFENETILVLIENNKNIFKITREDFDELEQELLDYDFCLIDNSKNQLYYMKIKEPNNFIRNAFDFTEKDEIYFGKEILQNKITEDELLKKIKSKRRDYV